MVTQITIGLRNGKDGLRRLGKLGVVVTVISAFLLIGLCNWLSYAEDEKPRKTGRIMKGISGEVSAVSNDFIAVVYRRDESKGSEEEIALPLAKDVIVEHKKALSEIGIGDMVDIEFEEIEEETKEGSRSKRVAKVVRFVRAAPKQAENAVLGAGAEAEDPAEE